jgi:hypothetical protein
MMLWLLLVVQNPSLSVTVPDGYRDISAEAAKLGNGDPRTKDVIALFTGTPGAADAASINFVRADHHPEDKLGDAKECAAFAGEMRDRQHAKSQTSSIVDGPSGKTCQIAVYFEKEKATAVSTILRGPKDTWTMTCVMGVSNQAALKQCQKTLGTVKFR